MKSCCFKQRHGINYATLYSVKVNAIFRGFTLNLILYPIWDPFTGLKF